MYYYSVSIVDLFFPKMCVGCHKEGQYICNECVQKLVKPEQICPICCNPSLDGWTHPRCKSIGGMERLIVGLPYRGLVQDCLKKVKYKSAWEIIYFLFRLQNLDIRLQDCVVTSVPMWSKKETNRGFNQAEILSKLVAEKNKVMNLVLIERVRETKPMYGLTKMERKDNIEGAFEISKKLLAKSHWQNRVILVDDVWTTGASMSECAKILKRAGAKEVWGVTLAR